MESPISSIVAKPYMEELEIKDIYTAKHPHRVWERYEDGTFVVLRSTEKERFLEHINSMNPNIQFTVEDTRTDESIQFLDTGPTIPSPQQYICRSFLAVGITTTLLPDSVLLAPWHIEPRLSVLDHNCLCKWKTTSNKHCRTASTLFGPLNRANIKYNSSRPTDGNNNIRNNSQHNSNKKPHIVVH